MDKKTESRPGDDCTTEAYGEDEGAVGGACAADYFAGPGSDEWGPKAKARTGQGKPPPRSSAEKDLIRRVRQLEKELRKQQTRGRKSTKSDRKKKRHTPEPSETSDSDDSSRSRSPSSSSDSDRGSWSRSPKASSEKKGKYDRRRQMKRGDKIKNSITLIVYLVKLLQSSYKKGKRVRGLISHLLVMAEKAESGYYKLECLQGYGEECRENASERGITSFGEIRAAAVLRFLSYDSTTGAKRNQVQGGQIGQVKKQDSKGSCFKFNASGCHSTTCQFRHVCMFCGDSSHGSQSCRKGKSGSQSGNKGN